MFDVNGMMVASAVGGVMIILGFLALVTQRMYMVGGSSNQPTEIELPLLGKMKANYPAVIFVVLGASLVAYGISREEEEQTDRWTVELRSQTPGINWQTGHLFVVPTGMDTEVQPDNTFLIDVDVPRRKALEDYIELIQYTTGDYTMTVVPSSELALRNAGKASQLQKVTPRTRIYNVRFNKIVD